mgnify:CR=1 FL=1
MFGPPTVSLFASSHPIVGLPPNRFDHIRILPGMLPTVLGVFAVWMVHTIVCSRLLLVVGRSWRRCCCRGVVARLVGVAFPALLMVSMVRRSRSIGRLG